MCTIRKLQVAVGYWGDNVNENLRVVKETTSGIQTRVAHPNHLHVRQGGRDVIRG